MTSRRPSCRRRDGGSAGRPERAATAAARSDPGGAVSADDLQVTDEPRRRVGGDGETELDIVLSSLVFPAGASVTVPFSLPLPSDAPLTGSAVHSTLVWFLEATLMYAKWTQGIKKVRRQIVVVNAA